MAGIQAPADLAEEEEHIDLEPGQADSCRRGGWHCRLLGKISAPWCTPHSCVGCTGRRPMPLRPLFPHPCCCGLKRTLKISSDPCSRQLQLHPILPERFKCLESFFGGSTHQSHHKVRDKTPWPEIWEPLLFISEKDSHPKLNQFSILHCLSPVPTAMSVFRLQPSMAH